MPAIARYWQTVPAFRDARRKHEVPCIDPVACYVSGRCSWAPKTRIFRCGNEYTNNAAEAKARAASWWKAATSPWSKAPLPPTPLRQRVHRGRAAPPRPAAWTATDQRARDNDARAILESELKKAEARQAELLKEYNNGEPDKLGPSAQPPEVPGPRGRTQGQHRPQ
jgi:hypothetical protein